MPASLEQLAQVEPVYETLPGWKEDITQCKTYSELPYNAQRLLSKIEKSENRCATLPRGLLRPIRTQEE